MNTLALIGLLFLLPSAPDSLSTEKKETTQLTVGADFLSRGEVRHGGLPAVKEDAEPPKYAAFLVERTRLAMDYRRPGLAAEVIAEQSGVWGDAGDKLSLYQAWMEFSFGKGFFAKVGRQNLSYDDQRIFGADDWSMTGSSHDVLKLGFAGRGHQVHLFGAFNQNAANTTGGTFFSGGLQPYKDLEGLWYHYDVTKWNLGVSAIAVNIGMQAGTKDDTEYDLPRVHHQQLVGTYLHWSPEKWEAEASFYYQMGIEENGLPLSAWMASVKGTARPDPRLHVSVGYDYLSGDEYFATPARGEIGMVRHDRIRGFSSIYGSHHKFYGAMDFFYVTTYVNGFTPGLQNAYVSGSWSPLQPWTLDLAYHYLAIATHLEDVRPTLGHEVEFSTSWAFTKDISLSAGYSYMFGTETMEVLKRTTENHNLHWGWLMLRVSPEIFSHRR